LALPAGWKAVGMNFTRANEPIRITVPMMLSRAVIQRPVQHAAIEARELAARMGFLAGLRK
jgi:hypothetical protein